jgi:hypothetical protein
MLLGNRFAPLRSLMGAVMALQKISNRANRSAIGTGAGVGAGQHGVVGAAAQSQLCRGLGGARAVV